MTVSTINIPGMNERTAAKLSQHGVHTRAQLITACHDPKQRNRLEQGTGLSTAELHRFAGRAELLGVTGLHPAHVGLLIDAGITTLRDLAHANATQLQTLLAEHSTVTHAKFHPAMSLRHMLGWIAQARRLAREMSH